MESWHTVSWPLPVSSRATNGNAPPATALSDPDRNSLQKWPLRGVNVPIFPKLSRQIYPECWSHPIRYSHVSGWTPPLSMTFAKIVTEDSAFWDKPRLGLRESLHQFSEITSTKKQKKIGPTKKWFNQPVCWLYHVISPSLCREMLGFPHLF